MENISENKKESSTKIRRESFGYDEMILKKLGRYSHNRSYVKYIEESRNNNPLKKDEWTEHDEYMRMHAPIRPPEVEMCWLCKNKSVGQCDECQKYACQRHLRTCAVCHSKICIICCAEEYGGEAYCEDCSEDMYRGHLFI